MLQTELSIVRREHSFHLPEPRERTNPKSRHYQQPLEREISTLKDASIRDIQTAVLLLLKSGVVEMTF